MIVRVSRERSLSGISFCGVASDQNFECSSVSFSTNGISYQRVCARARGCQKGDAVAFYGFSTSIILLTIGNDCVSGLSITYSSNPGQWSTQYFGLLLAVVVEYLSAVTSVYCRYIVLLHCRYIVLLPFFAAIINVNQLLCIASPTLHIISITQYGME